MNKTTIPQQNHTWYDPLIKFGTHIIVGIILFSAIAVSAYLLHLLVHWMEEHRLDEPLVLALRWVTYAIFAVDVFVFMVHLIHSTTVFVKEIWK